FVKGGIVKKTRSSKDGRENRLTLTRKGHGPFTAIDNASNASVRKMLQPLEASERKKLMELTRAIKIILSKSHESENHD
ncbi:MAG TPA: MarR family winged helix-turn-helix transcriptional regulator, partial [Bacteroidota bacterium]|nr:MarR family winged helix-turn-helix transcriptional regulator [Bacteroidota bacterium]